MNISEKSKQVLALCGLVLATLSWGVAFILVKWAMVEMTPEFYLFLRFAVGTFCLVILFWKKLKNIPMSTVWHAALLSIYLCGALFTQTAGLKFTTASNSALITGLYLVFIPFIAHFALKQVIPATSLAGALFSFIGLFFLTQYNVNAMNIGDLLTLICAAFAALHIVTTDIYSKKDRLIPLVVLQLLFSTFFTGAYAVFTRSIHWDLSATTWGTVLLTGIVATALAFTLQTFAQRVIDPTRAGVIFSLESVFGSYFGWLLGGETFTQLALFGAILMVMGMIISELKPVIRYLIDKITG
ncbi:MAG: hypothetical protein COV43_03915 [Deltaproteobacteria bacterium CG11_big_fil_rev_8_21_14_0_20_42_23]|nr:MAG: hypothetical protein COV43_03915 [Deltaproteobacteria bacterium CG11_big_fil_rev_8_21_14_0_20_42_23]PJC63382.1 MAG: hypothetical protein CO021_09885 [Deltaproteobacteria bacterium CG_4_9_14_0_2_um_filter_42_21]